MARIASTTSAGVPTGPMGGMTLDALLARAKATQERQGDIAAPRQILSPWQGAAQLAESFVNARQGAYAEDQAQAGRAELARLLAQVDPETGATPDISAQIYSLDPEAGARAMEAAAEAIRAKRQREQQLTDLASQRQFDIANREDQQKAAVDLEVGRQGFTTGERKAGETFTTAQDEAARQQAIKLQEDQQAAQADAAAKAAAVAAEKPITGSAQAQADYLAGRYGAVGSPEAIAARDAEITKATAVAGPSTIINTGDSGDMRKKFNEKVGGELFPSYMKEAATAGGLMRGMELLDALATNPQGPVVGRIAQMFPGFDTNAAAFESVVRRLAPAQREPGSGSTSDIEYKGMLASLPQLINNPEANRLISAAVKAQAALAIERGKIVQQWQARGLTDDAAMLALSELDSRSIMTPQLQKMIDAAQTNQPLDLGTGTPGTGDPEVDDLVKQYTSP